MFAEVMDAFDERVQEIDLFCDLLSGVESGQIGIADGGDSQTLAVPADWAPMLKGSLYLVLYNLVEAFVRKGFQEVFEAIRNDQLCGIDLTKALRVQWIMQKNRQVKPLDGSPNTYMQIASKIVDEIATKTVATMRKDFLPYPGTLDADRIRRMCNNHGVKVVIDPAARGGFALETVKTKRNNLAHGDESFAECGRQVTSGDLIRAKEEIVCFMRGVLASLERFAKEKEYKEP